MEEEIKHNDISLTISGKMNKYKCNHCNKIVDRPSNKKWIKSLCGKTGKTVHLSLIK